MKHIFIVIFTLVLAHYAHLKSFEETKSACLEVSVPDEANLKEAYKGTYVEDDAVAAYFQCFFMHMGFITFTADEINNDIILEKLPTSDKAKAKVSIDSCVSKLKERNDRKSHELYTCFVKELGAINNFA